MANTKAPHFLNTGLVKFQTELYGTSAVPPTSSPGWMTVSWSFKVVQGLAALSEKAHPEIDMPKAIKGGSATTNEGQIVGLKDVKTYLNGHTTKFSDGEIRGRREATI